MDLPTIEILGLLNVAKSAQFILENGWQVHLNSRRKERVRSGLVSVTYRLAVSKDGGRSFTAYSSFGQSTDGRAAKAKAIDGLLAQIQ